MRPITLKLSGLQSYRELQTIDFTELCDTGLFGIFGPTGSGKSTLLDAMTLALYGKVGRASGGTQGIMNHSEDALFVSFTFELMSASGPEQFRVERRFKRVSDISVSNTISRFIEIQQGAEIVIADKLADVTRCVEEKIGLKMEDFTRAVVLPQGKFADFLSLKGADRRQMLQRLFHLEKYGDLLGQKLARKVKETEASLKELAAEQQGLGHASKEALREAEAAVGEAAQLAKLRRSELEAAQEQADTLGKLREWSEERSRRLTQLSSLRSQDEGIAEMEKSVTLAASAASLTPALTAWKESQQQAVQLREAAERAARAAQLAATAAQEAAVKAEEANTGLSREEPGLLLRLQQLEEAASLQKECRQMQVELEELTAKHRAAESRQSETSDQLNKEQALLSKAEQRKQELEDLLKGNEVAASERALLHGAGEHKQKLLSIREHLNKAITEENGLSIQVKQTGDKHQAASLRLKGTEAGRQRLVEGVLHVISSLEETYTSLAEDESWLLAQEEITRIALKDREALSWARRLAQDLNEDAPCPVCGSKHHPLPAGIDPGEASGNHEEDLNIIADLVTGVRTLKTTVSNDINETRVLLEQIAIQPAGDISSISGDEAAVTAAIEPEARSPVTLGNSLHELGIRLTSLTAKHSELRSSVERLLQEGRALKNEVTSIEAAVSSTKLEYDLAVRVREQASQRRKAYKEEEHSLLQAWHETYPDLSPEEVEERRNQILSKDRQTEDLKQRLQLSKPFIEEKNARILALRQELVNIEKELVQGQAMLQGKQEMLQDKQKRLSAQIGDGSVEQQLNLTRQRLELLRQTAEDARKLSANLSTQYQEQLTADKLAAQAASTAEEQGTALRERWISQLEQSPFEREQDVFASYMDEDQIKSYTEQIDRHREAVRELEVNLKELEAKLEGRLISDEEWQACRTKLAAAKEQNEAAIQAYARCQRDLEDISARHLRWSELEEARILLTHQMGLLGKLQSTLRGNAFVEYVAEEQLMNVSRAASGRLHSLTKQRYSLETDSGGGFVICDDANGGIKRPVATLSGGETFLTSLALALALSAQIQLRGRYPLQFFFLDEGFGTLDPDLLETVITSLEHLHHDHLSVGVISHVAELRTRLPRRVIVIPAENGGGGSRVVIERM